MKSIISDELLESISDETVDEFTEMAIAQGLKFASEDDARSQVRILLLLFSRWIDEAFAKADEEFEKKRSRKDSNT